MAVITPSTDVYLLKVPLEINDNNQLTFSNATAQYDYFNSLPKIEVHDFTYQRKDGVIRLAGEYDELINYNYVMYRNDAFSNKWFYAYITNMEWKSPNCTEIAIKTDVWQTWQFDISFKPVLIDREHTNNDTRGANTLPEGLELGEYICDGSVINFGSPGTDYVTVVEVAQIENEGDGATLSYAWASGSHNATPRINAIDRGTIPLVVGYESGWQNTASYVTRIYEKAGLSDAIVNIYVIPKTLVGNVNRISLTVTPRDGSAVTTYDQLMVPESTTGVYSIGTSTFTAPTTIRDFTPKNNKLLTYPFMYFTISNNAGTSIPFRYEDFQSSISFKTEGTFGISGSTKTIPLNYKYVDSSENALDFSVTGPKYPVCSWRSDSYTNWLTQNAMNLNHEMTKSGIEGLQTEIGTATTLAALAAASGIATPVAAIGVAGAAAAAGAAPIIGTALEQHRTKSAANLTPDQVSGNTGAGDFLWAKYRSPFTFMPMSIKPEVAQCIDEFFSQYGYKCNRVKVPNITGRRNWNYVKTVGCYIEADIPQEDLQEIKTMYDRGITLWHNPSTFMDYTQTNDII